jgi:2-keto-4-pentenoate hydratase/2-oxohepta-3-ene-1,7-dioic acid hydratase in catechol pathway
MSRKATNVERCIPRGRRLGRFEGPDGSFMGLVDGDSVEATESTDLSDLLEQGSQGSGASYNLGELRVLPPVHKPSKIICIGLNYRSHIKEMGWETPKVPIIFTKPPSAIVGPGDSIVMPSASSRVDFEGESAIVIGARAKNVSDGAKHILGYTCLNDVTARDLQKTDPDWTRAKGFDTFAPIGPFISAAPPTRVETRLNGKVVQSSPLSDRVFWDAELVGYISTVMTLEPGDVIATGTPSGVAPMKAGDVVEVELDGVGCLKNPVVGP